MMIDTWSLQHVKLSVQNVTRVRRRKKRRGRHRVGDDGAGGSEEEEEEVVVEPESDVIFLDPYAFFPRHSWTRNPKLIHQFATQLKARLRDFDFPDAAVYIDIWKAKNGRYRQVRD